MESSEKQVKKLPNQPASQPTKKTKKLSYNQAMLLLLVVAIFTFGITGYIRFYNTRSDGSSQLNKTPAGQVALFDNNLAISQPVSNQAISSPVQISGQARVFEGLVFFRVVDSRNVILANGSVETGVSAPDWGQYSQTLEYSANTPTGFIEIYSQSDDDGSVQDLIRIPVQFSDFTNQVLNVFYSNINQDPELLNCDIVYPVPREVPFAENILAVLLGELFEGLTDEDIEQGFVNNLPELESGVQVISMSLATTTLT